MDLEEFSKRSEQMFGYTVNYLENISQRYITPSVSPGYLRTLIPPTAPNRGESFDKIMEDFDKCIIPGLTHWQHPRFHAFYPAISTYPGILAETIGNTIGCVGFRKDIYPAESELEIIVLKWFGKMIGLPDSFLPCSESSRGCGMINCTTSECILLFMVAARQDILQRVAKKRPSLSKVLVISSLVAYCSKESHRCIQKAATIAMVKLRMLDTDKDFRLRGETLENAIQDDRSIGLIPFFVNASIGTGTGACDPIEEIGLICEKNGIWLNVDASYAGNACVCPEYQHHLKGIEYASSFDINPAKWLMVHISCSVAFAKDRTKLENYAMENGTFLGFSFSECDRSFQSNKVFRAIKLWIMFRSYGIEGLQEHIRNHVRLAKLFAEHVRKDERFEVLTCNFGIVCFRLNCSNATNKMFLKAIICSGRLLLNSCTLREKFVLRFVVRSLRANEDDIIDAWTVIRELADEVLQSNQECEDSNILDECTNYHYGHP